MTIDVERIAKRSAREGLLLETRNRLYMARDQINSAHSSDFKNFEKALQTIRGALDDAETAYRAAMGWEI